MSLDKWTIPRKRAEQTSLEAGTSSSNRSTERDVKPSSTQAAGDLQEITIELSPGHPFTIIPPTFPIESAFSAAEKTGIVIQRKSGLDLLYFKPFLLGPGRKQLFRYLLEALPWYKVTYQARGKAISTPRYTTVFGKDASIVPESSYYRAPRQIPPALRLLKEEVERRVGEQFNFVLVNFYKDGTDSITYHSDDEGFLGPDPTIASLTLGGARDFLMRPKDATADKPQKWLLSSGDMIVMRGTTQRLWEHAIPKRASAEGRINITFRKAMNARGTNNYYRYNVGDGPVLRWRDGKMVESTM